MMMMTTADKHGVLKYRKRPCRCYCFCGYQFAYQKKSNIKKKKSFENLRAWLSGFSPLSFQFHILPTSKMKRNQIWLSGVHHLLQICNKADEYTAVNGKLYLDARFTRGKKCQEKPDFLPTGSNLYQHSSNMSSTQRDFSVLNFFWIESF